jgi:CRISPR-associated protein Cas5t
MLYLYLEAPFAAFRTFTAGWFRPTATFLTPSAAYGLLLNVAGIESRLREEESGHDGKTPASYMRRGLPACRIALGRVGEHPPLLQSAYQQLHNYPVGKGNKVDDPENPGEQIYQGNLAARRSAGNKSNITPVRREFLAELRAVIALDGPDLEAAVRRGLRGEVREGRYGVPFLGDNAFLLDRLEEIGWPDLRFPAVRWYERLGAEKKARTDATRLTILIDRADLSQTTSALFAPGEPSLVIPDSAWTSINPPDIPPAPPPRTRTRKS